MIYALIDVYYRGLFSLNMHNVYSHGYSHSTVSSKMSFKLHLSRLLRRKQLGCWESIGIDFNDSCHRGYISLGIFSSTLFDNKSTSEAQVSF